VAERHPASFSTTRRAVPGGTPALPGG
jgi:hypothetical protein